MSLFKGLGFRHRVREDEHDGPPEDEDASQADTPPRNQRRQRQLQLEPKGSGSRGSTPAASKAHPDDIKQSIEAVKTFLAARLAMKCHSCGSNITKNFCVRDWMHRWSEGAQGNPKKGCYLCAATCSSCRALTCLGCGNKPQKSKKPREIEGYYMDWCCRNGRLFGMWLLLARYDRVEIRWQTSSTSENTSAKCKTYANSRKTQDARGIGYADSSLSQNNPFAALFFDGSGPPPASLDRPLRFQGADKKTDEFVGKIFDFVSVMIPGPANKNLPPELHGMLQLGLLLDKVAELLRNDSLDDVTRREHVYKNVFNLVVKLGSHPELIDLVQATRYHKQQTPGLEVLSSSLKSLPDSPPLVLGDKIASVGERLKQLAKQSAIVLDAAESQDLNTRSGKDLLDCCEDIVAIYASIADNKRSLADEVGENSPQEKWEAFHQEHAVSRDETVFEQSHAYYRRALAMQHSSPGRIKRMVTEVANMSTSLPIGIFVKVSESRPDIMRCLIMGPPDSPYGYALFE
ncbi:hypothetical protein FQN49_007134 [Arthroderma sp. PD_2]|nr:hypothetical protein FQN49_007134 [Arthroderma sp. PD_2]